MRITFPLLLLGIIISDANGESGCELDWTPYKDELCIKVFTNVETYDNAKEFCTSQGDDATSPSSLVIVKDADMQALLANLTEGVEDYIWLGGRYQADSSQFKWDNGEPLVYSNWMDGYPRNGSTDLDACIEMRPTEVRAGVNVNIPGKWAHETCRRRNLVMCQKPFLWSLHDAVNVIIGLRRELAKTNSALASVNARVVPVGSIYVQYAHEPTPGALWPSLSWQDITRTYGGLFFRAEGGGSTSWGTTQEYCAPRISSMQYGERSGSSYANLLNLPSSGWSEYLRTGRYYTNAAYHEGIRFQISDCEVRPRNQAIRIWKRAA